METEIFCWCGDAAWEAGVERGGEGGFAGIAGGEVGVEGECGYWCLSRFFPLLASVLLSLLLGFRFWSVRLLGALYRFRLDWIG